MKRIAAERVSRDALMFTPRRRVLGRRSYGCRCPEVFASVVPGLSAPAVRKSLRLPNASCQAENVQCDLPLLVARERLIGDQGEQEFGESWHRNTVSMAVIEASIHLPALWSRVTGSAEMAQVSARDCDPSEPRLVFGSRREGAVITRSRGQRAL